MVANDDGMAQGSQFLSGIGEFIVVVEAMRLVVGEVACRGKGVVGRVEVDQ